MLKQMVLRKAFDERWSPKIGQRVKVDCLTLLKEDHP